MKNYSVKIIVATHKKYQMPIDHIYIPLHVGADGKKDYFHWKVFFLLIPKRKTEQGH